MAAPFLPSVLFFEDIPPVTSSGIQPLNACIVGPNAQLVRHGQPNEKANGRLGSYISFQDTLYAWPNLSPGATVDLTYTRLFADSAKQVFYQKVQGSGDAITIPAGTNNRVSIAGTLGFQAGTTGRLAELYGRDVKLGDRVRVSGTVSGTTYTADSYVTGFSGNTVNAVVGSAGADAANVTTQSGSVVSTQVAGTTNCNTINATGLSFYNGLVDGSINEVYTVTVIQGSVGGDLTTALIRVKSASGLDDIASVAPAAAGAGFTVGVRGLELIVNQSGGPCDLLLGQVWQLTLHQSFNATVTSSAGTYSGTVDDTYVVTVTRGGFIAETNPAKKPQWSVTTVRGLDSSGPTTLTAANVAIPIGTRGATLKLNAGTTGVCKGDRFYVNVTAATIGTVSTLILANVLPTALQAATDMNLWLYLQGNVEIPKNRVGYDPLTNYQSSTYGVTVAGSIVLYDPGFVDNIGNPLPLPLLDGTIYVQYRAWLPQLSYAVHSISDPGNLSQIPGAIDQDNPLSYAVSKALVGANGTSVGYVAVNDPLDHNSWATAINKLVGRMDVYSIVPLTYDPEILSLFVAHVHDQSSAEKGRERKLFLGLQATLDKQVIGPDTSSDGDIVLATLAANPDAPTTQYTLLNVPADNAKFITHGVQVGDQVRYEFGTSFGEPTYQTFLVNSVVGEGTLLLQSGAALPVTTPQRLEIWHSLTNDEIMLDLETQAANYSDVRVIAVWSDLIGLDPVTVDTYHLAAGVAGEIAGVLPQQGLTNVTLGGFNDVVSSSGLFNRDEIASMCGNGVWVISRDSSVQSNAVITRLATTTVPTPITSREEMVQRNLDSCVQYVRTRLNTYLVATNVTPSSASLLRVEVNAAHNFLISSGFTQSLGGQLIDATFNDIRPHAVFADRYVIDVTWTIPIPLNTIEFHITVVTSSTSGNQTVTTATSTT